MKVVNDNNIGNPYHDEEGKFTTSDGVGSGGPSTPSSGDDYTDDDLLGLYDEVFDGDIEENEELQKLFGEDNSVNRTIEKKYDYSRFPPLTPINKMTRPEILKEIKETIINLKKFNVIPEKNFLSTHLKMKLAFLRQINTVCEKYQLYGIFELKENYDDTIIPNLTSVQTGGYIASCDPVFFGSSYSLEQMKKLGYSFCMISNIYVNSREIVKDELVPLRMKGQIQKGYHNDVDEDFYYEYYACHEMGHVLSNYLMNILYEKGIDLRTNSKTSELVRSEGYKKHFKDEIFSIFKKQNPDLGYNDFLKDVSQYGNSNADEWFAETFASMNGGKPTKSALAMKQWLDEQFNYNDGGNK